MTSSAGMLAGADLRDSRLLALDAYCREAAGELRKAGEALDRDPWAIGDFLHLPAVSLLRHRFVPPEYRPAIEGPPVAAGASCREWVIVLDRLGYGDPGTVLASPGPSLSGGAIIALADERQRDWYFSRLAATEPAWTFFGLTEPAKGSAALELETRLIPDGDDWLLDGEKRYIGNGARAQLGVVFCRRAPGPWGIEAVLVDAAEAGFTAELLPSLGLRGAAISRLRFDRMRIPRDRVLGVTRPASRRGIYGATECLLRARPSIAAMALGVTQAVLDYISEHRRSLSHGDQWRMDGVADRAAVLRSLVHEVAAEIDGGTVNMYRIGAVKMRSARLAVAATMLAAELLGPASLVEHPWLEKTYRDVRGLEFMEGTSNIHRLAVFQGLLKGDFFPDRDPETEAGYVARS